ncbi:cytoplasmic protein [Gymnopilus junonius]|uniref:Cytoplasmic protein n=1 Tax=Gymnopilus junonius TaxID=109634 RepID=A0A9P5NYX9_GYMJU|nr:cytoplasmic protein [Gymnopilus junonius]
MHLRWTALVPVFSVALAPFLAHASPASYDRFLERSSLYEKRDGSHHHNAHAAPLLVLNETEVTMYHAPTPPSYYTLDFEDEGHERRPKGFMIFHGISMCLAFFVSLPVGIVLRSVNHAAHSLATASFYTFIVLGCASSGIYRKMSPNMYEGAVHSSQGYFIIAVAISLSALDIIAALRRFITFLRSSDKSLKSFWRTVVKKEHIQLEAGPEYSAKMMRDSVELQDVLLDDDSDRSHTEQWANAVHQHRRQFSMASDGTVIGSHSPGHSQDTFHDAKARRMPLTRLDRLSQIGNLVFTVVERSLVLAGFAQVLTGIVIYTGCLSPQSVFAEGAIFWCYGLLTFARFLGSYADRGWAWNRTPTGDPYTAEFVESFVIFLYGATNTWMERFGAKSGDPFTTKQIQHISIAVMFWFAGLLGMGIESKTVRKWLASSTFAASSSSSDIPQEAVEEPASYLGSFNPFPALVIGVTGAAMAAHAQTYLFQASRVVRTVQIHALWGNLLVAFSVLRCLTYFFLWLGPPRSILPSRPPTEALGSFFLACGGLVFISSDEEITIAAMRRGRDDVMMFLNVAVAITCLGCCWTLAVVGFKGWLKSRTHSVTYRHAS